MSAGQEPTTTTSRGGKDADMTPGTGSVTPEGGSTVRLQKKRSFAEVRRVTMHTPKDGHIDTHTVPVTDTEPVMDTAGALLDELHLARPLPIHGDDAIELGAGGVVPEEYVAPPWEMPKLPHRSHVTAAAMWSSIAHGTATPRRTPSPAPAHPADSANEKIEADNAPSPSPSASASIEEELVGEVLQPTPRKERVPLEVDEAEAEVVLEQSASKLDDHGTKEDTDSGSARSGSVGTHSLASTFLDPTAKEELTLPSPTSTPFHPPEHTKAALLYLQKYHNDAAFEVERRRWEYLMAHQRGTASHRDEVIHEDLEVNVDELLPDVEGYQLPDPDEDLVEAGLLMRKKPNERKQAPPPPVVRPSKLAEQFRLGDALDDLSFAANKADDEDVDDEGHTGMRFSPSSGGIRSPPEAATGDTSQSSSSSTSTDESSSTTTEQEQEEEEPEKEEEEGEEGEEEDEEKEEEGEEEGEEEEEKEEEEEEGEEEEEERKGGNDDDDEGKEEEDEEEESSSGSSSSSSDEESSRESEGEDEET